MAAVEGREPGSHSRPRAGGSKLCLLPFSFCLLMSSPSATVASKATLLIVDDEASVRRRLRQIFEGAGHHTLVASDAPKALSLLHREHCDLVILDVEMPGVDGLALCRLLRANNATKQLPIVIFSVRDDENRKVEAFAAGADDFIVKPSTPREILMRVGAHLETAQREWALVGSNLELRFLADLGRGLLRALDTEQVVRHVAGATFEGTGASLCAAALQVGQDQFAVCAFDREGSAEDAKLVYPDRLKAWLSLSATASSVLLTDPAIFFLRDREHRVEYAAPLRFG